MTKITETSQCGPTLNINKTKNIVISKNIIPLEQEIIPQKVHIHILAQYKWDNSLENKWRIGKATAAFVQMKNLFRS